MKLFAACSIWILLLSSLVQANVVWDKEINEFKTSYSIEHTDNLYNQTTNQITDSLGRMSANYHILKLFEGFAVSLPITLIQESYLEQSQLNSIDYSITPNIHFFISDETSVDFILKKSKNETFSGQEGAEFVEPDNSLITLNNELAQFNLNFGRDHKNRFIDLSFAFTNNSQKFKESELSKNDTLMISSTYGHRVSEDTYFLVNAKMSQGNRAGNKTDLQEFGLGFSNNLGGSHKLNVIAGIYKRKGDEISDGNFWRASDTWLISEQNQVSISTSQSSQISFANETLTQLNTEYQINWSHKLSKNQLLNLILKRKKQKFEQKFREYNKDLVSLSWTWLFIEGMKFQSDVQFQKISNYLTTFSNIKDNDIKVDQLSLNMVLEYTW
ncbi:hypothetical protein CJF42_00235 [Pseudoalteromonas sp. NBT06-2]|uniref:hypothetical protein n=1 Tax=Pseudoalteromonas sp. NBT06-2 TaxID=2025950 RepID=UPI000BA607C4|nr:hypothetical protein [Pseudoalteromonas sp. NBT06-2]PAJ76365.1 hypothetical protein CJF42_00235 [Pseudoalteromonas sp. NBT06-2]